MTAKRVFGFAAFLAVLCAAVLTAGSRGDEKDAMYNLIYVPTDNEVIEKMFDMAKVGKKDYLFDLGCGDCRILAMAAKKWGCKGVGVDLNPERVKESHDTIKKYGVEDLVWVRYGDALKVKDLNDATVITLYMLPEFMVKLEPQAKNLKPGTRIVSHDYKWSDAWPPDQTVEFKGPRRTHTLYLWTVKAK